MRLRQFAYAVRDLERGVADVESILGLELAYRDPAIEMFGLENAVFPLGEGDFLELLSPIKPDASAERYLRRRGGDTGYMVIVECADARALKPRIQELGVRIVFEMDTETHFSYHLHPADCGGVLLSIDSASEWAAAGPDWRDQVRTERTTGFAGLEIACDSPGATSELWAALLDVPESYRSLQLENAAIGFISRQGRRGPGIESVSIRVTDPEAVRDDAKARDRLRDDGTIDLCGARLDLADP